MTRKFEDNEYSPFFSEARNELLNQGQKSADKRPIARLAFIFSLLGLLANLLTFITADYGTVSSHLAVVLKWLPERIRASLSTHSWLATSANLWQLYLVFFILMLAITWYELQEGIIPDAITIPGLLIGLGMSFGYGNSYIGILSSLGGAAAGYAIFDLLNRIYRRIRGISGVGGGVLKMAAMIGAFTGIRNVLIAIWITSLVVSLYGVYVRLYSSRTDITSWHEIKAEMGPFLALISSLCIIFPIRRWLYGS